MQKFYSHGKLLLSGEYLILDGAIGLAVPTKMGQGLEVKLLEQQVIDWKSLDEKGQTWFSAKIDPNELKIKKLEGDRKVGANLLQIFRTAREMRPEFLQGTKGYEVRTRLEFPRDWGLGSSSTLINNIAQWANTDPFQLLYRSFGGSGYDIACANSDKAIFFYLLKGKPKALKVNFEPPYAGNLYFVHLNRKQSSSDSIQAYELEKKIGMNTLEHISAIGQEMARCKHLEDFILLIREHERIVSEVIGQPTVQELHFRDFPGQVKSLGAWGGDFVLAASKEDPTAYFKSKGYHTILGFDEMVL